jgi:adenine-specific DNA-methyltransferase
MLIQGDNLEALKALLPYYANRVKCIYIDPPYNTGSAFEHYDDNLEHSKWLDMMYPRLELLRELLAEDGVIFTQVDDEEVHYLKVIMDEIFGRKNFLNEISAKMKQNSGASGGGEDKKLKKNVEYILVYTKNNSFFTKLNDLNEEKDLFDLIQEMKNEKKSWKYTRVIRSFGNRKFINEVLDGSGQPIRIFRHDHVVLETLSNLMQLDKLSEKECYIKYFDKIFRDTNAQSSIRARVIKATKEDTGDFFSIEYLPISGKSKGKITTLYYKGNNRDLIAWLSDVAVKRNNKLLKLEKLGTFWDGFPLNNLTKEGSIQFPNGKKPERLIHRILTLATNEGDLVLDSFLGSGTTAAVAHKMNRRWIGIEMGEHAKTHCAARLQKVIDGEQGGISKAVDWQGGGGFRFYHLGETIFDQDGCINKNIKFEHLAAHIWFSETKTPITDKNKSPLIGIYNKTAYYLLYNGILGDKSVSGGNVLTTKTLDALPKYNGKKVIYGETTRLSSLRLEENQITFKQTPYDIKAR